MSVSSTTGKKGPIVFKCNLLTSDLTQGNFHILQSHNLRLCNSIRVPEALVILKLSFRWDVATTCTLVEASLKFIPTCTSNYSAPCLWPHSNYIIHIISVIGFLVHVVQAHEKFGVGKYRI